MRDFALCQQRFVFYQQGDNFFVNLVHMIAGEDLNIGAIITIVVDIVERSYVVLQTNRKVICTMIRSSMNKASTGFCGYVVAQNNRYLARVKRMLHLQVLQYSTFAVTDNFKIGDACAGHHAEQ